MKEINKLILILLPFVCLACGSDYTPPISNVTQNSDPQPTKTPTPKPDPKGLCADGVNHLITNQNGQYGLWTSTTLTKPDSTHLWVVFNADCTVTVDEWAETPIGFAAYGNCERGTYHIGTDGSPEFNTDSEITIHESCINPIDHACIYELNATSHAITITCP